MLSVVTIQELGSEKRNVIRVRLWVAFKVDGNERPTIVLFQGEIAGGSERVD